MESPRIRIAPAAWEEMHNVFGAALDTARLVGEDETADLLVLTPVDLEERIEDALAEVAYACTRDQESVPAELIDRLLAGANPIRVWREHRGFTLTALADKAEVSKGYLSQIENGQRVGTIVTLARLARVLGVDVDELARPTVDN
jgi:DNA-binding XRE family transcriptional regulator